MDMIKLLDKYNKNKVYTPYNLITIAACTGAIIFIFATLLSYKWTSIISFLIAFVLSSLYSHDKIKERILSKIYSSSYCGDLNKIFDMNNERTLMVLHKYSHEIQQDIENHHGITGKTIMEIINEIDEWKIHDSTKAEQKEFKTIFEGSNTQIGAMFEQIKTLNNNEAQK